MLDRIRAIFIEGWAAHCEHMGLPFFLEEAQEKADEYLHGLITSENTPKPEEV